MRKAFRKITQAAIIASLLIGSAGISGCKKKKELAAAEAAEAARIAEQVKEATAILEAILADENVENVNSNYKKLDKVIAMDLEDPAVKNLIGAAQEKLADDKVKYDALMEQRRIEAEKLRAEEAARMKIENDKNILNQHFEALTGQKDYEKANNIISNTLPMFASPDVPVLVIIAEENGVKDYDKPTTIKKYLEYLKDRKAYKADVDTIVYDESGKIKELELRKQ